MSPDLTQFVSGKFFITGTLHSDGNTPRPVKADRLWENAGNNLRLNIKVEDSTLFTFNRGGLVGDYLDSTEFHWWIEKEVPGTLSTNLDENEHETNSIGQFCLRPFVWPISPRKARMSILLYPLSKDDLSSNHPHYLNPSFPGIEVQSLGIPLFPGTDKGRSGEAPSFP